MDMNHQKLLFTVILIACRALCPMAHAVSPPPDGGYAGENTAEGTAALLHLNGGTNNTALGWASLGFDVTGNLNTAVGAGALLFNTADQNTATGAGALLNDTLGGFNTANGAFALSNNITGHDNTAVGDSAMYSNVTGQENTADGSVALLFNTGNDNTAVGASALVFNTTGSANTANGWKALLSNTVGIWNTAVGESALVHNSTGSFNVALGAGAGDNVTTGSNNVYIGTVGGAADESNTCYIGQIFGATSIGSPVLINSEGKLGTNTSSRRFKDDIRPLGEASEALFKLKPVSFRYNREIDPARTPRFGLVAEDVEKVAPNLVARDKEGKPYSVQYDQVNAMLLNEFLKAHQQVHDQKTTIVRLRQDLQSMIATQQKQIEALNASLQKVIAQIEVKKTASKVVVNHP
jgi:hypothetical protein